MSGAETTTSDNLIKGMCFINNIPLITIIDMSVMLLFIFVECVSRLNLEVSSISGSMVIDTLANGPVTALLVCQNYPLIIYGRYFRIEFMCFPLIQLVVILGMIWLEFNHVFINYFDKSMQFLVLISRVS